MILKPAADATEAAGAGAWRPPASPWDTPPPGMERKRPAVKPPAGPATTGSTSLTVPGAAPSGADGFDPAGAHPHGFGPASFGPASFAPPGFAPPGFTPSPSAAPEFQIPYAVDSAGRLIAAIPCRRCGYALRGISAASNCPECGVPVAESMRGDRLLDADPLWLASVGRGLGWCWILTIITPLVYLITWVLASTTMAGRHSESLLISIAATPLTIAKLLAWWTWTRPEAGGDDQQLEALRKKLPGSGRRGLVRTAAVVSLGASLLVTVLSLFGFTTDVRSFRSVTAVLAASSNTAGSIATLVWFLALVICFFATCSYVRHLATRAGNVSLVSFAQTTMFVAPVVAVMLVCIGIGPLVALIMWLTMLIQAEATVKAALAARKSMGTPLAV